MDKNGQTSLPFIPLSTKVLTHPHSSSSIFAQTQWVAVVAQTVAMATMTSNFLPKSWPKKIWPPIPRCATVSTLSHDAALYSKQTQWVAMVAQAVAMATMMSSFVQKPCPSKFSPYFLLCQRFNTVTWIRIKLSTHPVSWYDGTNRRYGKNDVMLCPKTWSEYFCPLFSFMQPFQPCHMT